MINTKLDCLGMNFVDQETYIKWLYSDLDEIIDMSGELPHGWLYSTDLSKINQYRFKLIEEMIKLDATENDLNLISDTLIQNSIKNNRTPKDVAWAIL